MNSQEIWTRFYIALNLQGHDPATAAQLASLKTKELLAERLKIK